MAPSRASTMAFDFTCRATRQASSRSARSRVVGGAGGGDRPGRRIVRRGVRVRGQDARRRRCAAPRRARRAARSTGPPAAAGRSSRPGSRARSASNDSATTTSRNRLASRSASAASDADRGSPRRPRTRSPGRPRGRAPSSARTSAPSAAPHGLPCLMIAMPGPRRSRATPGGGRRVEQVVVAQRLALERLDAARERPGVRTARTGRGRPPPPGAGSRRSAGDARRCSSSASRVRESGLGRPGSGVRP